MRTYQPPASRQPHFDPEDSYDPRHGAQNPYAPARNGLPPQYPSQPQQEPYRNDPAQNWNEFDDLAPEFEDEDGEPDSQYLQQRQARDQRPQPPRQGEEESWQWRSEMQQPQQAPPGVNRELLADVMRDVLGGGSPQAPPQSRRPLPSGDEEMDFETRLSMTVAQAAAEASENALRPALTQIERLEQRLEQQRQQSEAPRARDAMVKELTVGLGPVAQDYLTDYFTGYTSDTFDQIRQDPKTMDMLRRAAEYEHMKAGQARRGAPRTETTYGVPQMEVDGATEAYIKDLWRGVGQDLRERRPGLKYADFRKSFLDRAAYNQGGR